MARIIASVLLITSFVSACVAQQMLSIGFCTTFGGSDSTPQSAFSLGMNNTFDFKTKSLYLETAVAYEGGATISVAQGTVVLGEGGVSTFTMKGDDGAGNVVVSSGSGVHYGNGGFTTAVAFQGASQNMTGHMVHSSSNRDQSTLTEVVTFPSGTYIMSCNLGAVTDLQYTTYKSMIEGGNVQLSKSQFFARLAASAAKKTNVFKKSIRGAESV